MGCHESRSGCRRSLTSRRRFPACFRMSRRSCCCRRLCGSQRSRWPSRPPRSSGRRGRAAVILGFGLTLQVAAMAAVSLVWRSNRASIATPYAAGPALLRALRFRGQSDLRSRIGRFSVSTGRTCLAGSFSPGLSTTNPRRRTRCGEAPAGGNLRGDGHDGRVSWRPSAAEDRSFVRADRRLGRGLVRPELEETAAISGCRCGTAD